MNPRPRPSIAELHVGDEPGIWEGLGFGVEGNRCRIGTVDIIFIGDEPGIHGWVLRDSLSTDFGPLPTRSVDTPIPERAEPHPNRSIGFDHVVLSVPFFEEGMTAVAATGVSIPKPRPFGAPEKRMLRTAPEMGDLELELIGPESRDSTRPWDLWGLVVTVNDIDATVDLLGELLRPAKGAVQAGRRIATVDKSAGSGVAIAFLGPQESKRTNYLAL